MRTIPACLLLLSLSGVVVGQTPDHSAANAVDIQGAGCVENAVETSCHVLIDSKNGEIYNLFFGTKVPKPGAAIRFTGTAHQGMTTCMQGKPVDVSVWKKAKGIKCPPATTTSPTH